MLTVLQWTNTTSGIFKWGTIPLNSALEQYFPEQTEKTIIWSSFMSIYSRLCSMIKKFWCPASLLGLYVPLKILLHQLDNVVRVLGRLCKTKVWRKSKTMLKAHKSRKRQRHVKYRKQRHVRQVKNVGT